MNFCCHDDYTLVGKFTADHKNIYIAWQDWLTTFGPTDPLGTLEDFKNHYTLLESQGLVSGLISEVKKLPDHPSTDLDCADFTEQGEIFADDKNIFIAFFDWLSTFADGEALGTLQEFESHYALLESQGLVSGLISPVKHLPSLESDDQVITVTGPVDKNCGEPQPWDTAGNADQDGLIIITTNLSETLTTNTDEGDTTTGSTIVECEYVPFSSTGADQEYIVPENVTSIFAHVWGAGGSSGRYTNTAGSGGYAEGQFAVTPGEKLIFGVGETTKGTTNDTKRIPGYSIGGSAGYGGNGAYDPPPGSFPATFFPSSDGLSGAGAGGGMSGIFRESITPENALIIAGGGGGAANVTYNGVGGGAGGGENGDAGSVLPGDKQGGAGATQLSGGDGHFLGSDGETNSWASGGGGGAGYFGGDGGKTTSATWTNEPLPEAAQGTGGGGSGYLDNVIVSGSFSTGTTGAKGETTLIKSPKPNMINCADDTVVTCTPDFICIEEPGNGSDIPTNLAGMAGTYQLRNRDTESFLTDSSLDGLIGYNNTWIRTTTYLGNKKPSSSYAVLTRKTDAWGGRYWIYYTSTNGYSDMHGHAINPAQYTVPVESLNIHFNIPKLYDSENTETDCITKATSILFDNSYHVGYNKQIPIIVSPTECPPVECTFEISNITDTEPTGTENTIGTFDLTINLSSLYAHGTSGYVRAMEAEFAGIELAKNDAIVATTFDLYKNDSSKTIEEQEMWTELSNRTQTILSDIGETTQSRNKIMFADLLQNQGFRLADYANTTLTFTISYTQKFTDYFYVSSAEFYDSSTDINNFHGVICTPNTPTPSPSITPSPTISPTITTSPTVTPSPTISPTITASPTVTPSPTISPTITTSPTVTPSRTTSYTPSPTFTCGEPDYTNVENTFVCVNGMTLQFAGFDKLESQGGRPFYETSSGDARIYWGGSQGWILIVCANTDEPLKNCWQSDWTHSIPNACDFYPWEAEWPVTYNDPRIEHLVDDRIISFPNKYFDYWYSANPAGGESGWYGSVDVKNCTPCDACLVEPNQYKLVSGGLPAVNSLSAEWYRNFGGTLCYGSIHYDATTTNFEIFKTYIAYVENDATPIGTITLTGDFVGSDLITYQSPLNECYIATPTIEGSQNVYRFVKEEATPTPTDTSSPTHTPSPTFTPSPSPTITPSPTHTPSPSPSPSVTHTPSPTETPESELSCCTEGSVANIISKNTEVEFGSPTITATAFTFNAEVCVDVPNGGLPYSVKLKLNNAIVGVLTTTGVMTGIIYAKNTDTDVCYTGTISDDECSLTILQ